MTGAEAEPVRAALEAAALRLAPWATPEGVAAEVGRVIARAHIATLTEQSRAPSIRKLTGQLEAVREAARVLAAAVAELSPEAVAEIRCAALRLEHPDSKLGLEVARLDAQALDAQERIQRGRDRPASPEAVIGKTLVGAIGRLTGKNPTFTTDPITNAVTGPAVDFVRDALAALGIKASAEHILREGRRRRREADQWLRRARAERRAAPVVEPSGAIVQQGS